MNLIQALYCNQYYELKPKGKAYAARQNGTVLTALALLLYFFGVIFLLVTIFPEVSDWFGDGLKKTFGRQQGRMAGRLIAAAAFFALFGLVKLIWDRPVYYNRTIEAFEALPDDRQKEVSKKGLRFFMVSLAVFIPALVLFFLFGT